jgi:hypothetical protein
LPGRIVVGVGRVAVDQRQVAGRDPGLSGELPDLREDLRTAEPGPEAVDPQ